MKTTHKHAINVNLDNKPATEEEIEHKRKSLREHFRGNINFVMALFVLALGVAYRAISLEYDPKLELLKVCLSIGCCFGLFVGVMVNGNLLRKLQVAGIGTIFCSSAGLASSVLVMLLHGQLSSWIISVTILASALGGMWLITYYDEVLEGFDSVKDVNEAELDYIKKAAYHFTELNAFCEQIRAQGRLPVQAEYWAFREWVKARAQAKQPH